MAVMTAEPTTWPVKVALLVSTEATRSPLTTPPLTLVSDQVAATLAMKLPEASRLMMVEAVLALVAACPLAAEDLDSGKQERFQVTREETAPFPGDWEPLRGRNVKIISVQKIQENEKNSGAQAKLEFAKSLLDKNYAELAAKSQELSGIVLIFDSVDGGMIAATLPTVQAWKAGTLSDAALWHQCYFDPPETFSVASPAGGH